MKKNLFFIILITISSLVARGQVPALPTKATLSETLLSSKVFSNSSQEDTVIVPHTLRRSYTLEVVAKVNSATGRGLDIEARDSATKGYRLTLDTSTLWFTSALALPGAIAASYSGEQQTIRVAVNNDTAYIYRDGTFVYARPLTVIDDIVNGVEEGVATQITDDTNLLQNWTGTSTDNSGKPSAYGWAFSGTDPFNTANSGSGVRYMDNLSGLTYNGSAFTGRSMYIRWDGNGYTQGTYSYPVTLEANTTYDFSMLYTFISNYNSTNTTNTIGYSHGNTMLVGIGTSAALADRYDSLVYTPDGTAKTMLKKDFTFTSHAAGTYYLTFTGAWALYDIAQLTLYKISTPESRFIFGKDYPSGAVDMQIVSATYDSGAYAPTTIITKPKQAVSLTGGTYHIPTIFNADYIVTGKTDFHLDGDVVPMVNATVALNSDSSWLFVDNVKPSQVISDWLNSITINGQTADTATNVRVAEYVNGAVVIPNGNSTDQKAITFFTGENFTGDSVNYEIYTLHDSLGAYDNKFRSFKLRRGYMATIGSNAKGLGFSKVYIADMHDIDVPVMPKGLYDKTSFIRTFRWEYVSKKGWAGGGDPLEQVNATWSYDWSAGGNSTVNTQYTPIRQNAGWPDWNQINTKQNSNHLLGFNEPDHTDQANMTVDQAIQQWPQMLQSGFRLGSPAPSSPNSWLKQFMDKADSLNYRVDFVAVHCYWNSRVSGGHADSWYSGLLSTYNNWGDKRPIWITEWNNGANWTGESWPSDTTAALAKQAADLPLILQVFDTTSFIERYSIYNWVEYKRAMTLADTLTPAGKIYAADKSALAYTSDPDVYKPADIYDHTWRISAPIIRYTLTNDYKKAVINWLDINCDLGSKYVLERKADNEAGFTQIAAFNFNQDYAEGSTLIFTDSMSYDTARYRLYAVSYEGDTSWYTASLVVAKDPAPLPPVLSGNAISATQIKLGWTLGANARSFNLKRSVNRIGSYDTIAGYTTDTAYTDKGLNSGTTYYYTISSLNSKGESNNSDTLTITTPVLAVPDSVSNFYVASGDAKANITWDAMFDAKYTILRSTSATGMYDTVATALDTIRYEDAGIQNGSTYYYKIFAYNDVGKGPVSTAQSATPELGQYLHLGFNEDSGSVARDNWGGYHGTLYNGISWSSGQDSAKGAIALNASSQSYVQLPQGAVSRLNDFTLSALFKIPAGTAASNARLFDFGSNTSVFMVLMPYSSGGIRYKITCPAGTYDKTIPDTLPTGQWINLKIMQQGAIFKLYVNDSLLYTDSGATVKPSDMGVTTANYLGKSQFTSDPYGNFIIDDFNIYDYALSDPGGLLPVQLTLFTANLQTDNSVSLNWSTASEQNNDRFIIERGSDGKTFNKIAIVNSASPATGANYGYVDRSPLRGVNYYRLSQVDKDGSLYIDGVLTVSAGTNDDNRINIYPNPPTSNSFTIKYEVQDNENVRVSIFDMSGREVYKQSFLSNKSHAYNVTGLHLTPGIYIVKVNNSECKLIKK